MMKPTDLDQKDWHTSWRCFNFFNLTHQWWNNIFASANRCRQSYEWI